MVCGCVIVVLGNRLTQKDTTEPLGEMQVAPHMGHFTAGDPRQLLQGVEDKTDVDLDRWV